mgnify:CR=1 FL=1
MRTFEIPSMGGLMLTTRSNEQNKFFPENKASLMFKDIQNLTKKLNIYWIIKIYQKKLDKKAICCQKNIAMNKELKVL